MIPEIARPLIKTIRPAQIMQFCSDEGNSGGSAKAASNKAGDNSGLVKSQANQAKLIGSKPLNRAEFFMLFRDRLKTADASRDHKMLPFITNNNANPQVYVYTVYLNNLNLEGLAYDEELYGMLHQEASCYHYETMMRSGYGFRVRLNLEGSNLKDSKWEGVGKITRGMQGIQFDNLSGANFQGGEFQSCDFFLARIADANLKGAKFLDSKFKLSNFERTKFAGAAFERCEFKKSFYADADFKSVSMDQVALDFPLDKYDLTGASISELIGLDLLRHKNLEELSKINLGGRELDDYKFNMQIHNALKKAIETGEEQLLDFSGQRISRVNFYPYKIAKALLGDIKNDPRFQGYLQEACNKLIADYTEGAEKILQYRFHFLEFVLALQVTLVDAVEKASWATLSRDLYDMAELVKLDFDYSTESVYVKNRIQEDSQGDKNRIASIRSHIFENAAARLLPMDKLLINFDEAEINDSELSFLKPKKASFREAVLEIVSMDFMNLQGADFRGAQLVDVDLHQSNLKNAKFPNALLQFVSTHYSDWSNTTLCDSAIAGLNSRKSKFRSADFRNVNFENLANSPDNHFTEVDFSRAKFNNCNLAHTSFGLRGQKFNYTDFSGAIFPPHFIFYDPVFKMTNFEGARLDHVRFNRAKLIGTNFKDASLRFSFLPEAEIKDYQYGSKPPVKVDFSDADMSSLDLSKTKLKLAKFEGANLYQYKGRRSNKEKMLKEAGAKFERTSLTHIDSQIVGGRKNVVENYGMKGSDLSGHILSRKNYCGQDLTMVNFAESTIASSDLSRTQISAADFTGTRLKNVNLQNALIDQCIFDGTRFEEKVDLSNAVLRCLDLTNVEFGDGVIFNNTAFYNCDFPEHLDVEALKQSAALKEVDELYYQGLNFKHYQLTLLGKENLYYDLRNADLRGAILAGFNLGNCYIDGSTRFDETTNFHRAVAVPRFLAQKFGEGQRFTIKGDR